MKQLKYYLLPLLMIFIASCEQESFWEDASLDHTSEPLQIITAPNGYFEYSFPLSTGEIVLNEYNRYIPFSDFQVLHSQIVIAGGYANDLTLNDAITNLTISIRGVGDVVFHGSEAVRRSYPHNTPIARFSSSTLQELIYDALPPLQRYGLLSVTISGYLHDQYSPQPIANASLSISFYNDLKIYVR